MKVNSNLQAMVANRVLKKNEAKFSASTEKMSSGYKINRAGDSPSGMAITNKMRAQIKSLNKAKDNASNAINAVQTADGALTEVHEMLQRMNELSIKASNGTMTEADRKAVQDEINQLTKEIDRVASDTEYNTQNLLGGYQNMKGYTNTPDFLKVTNYDVDFPKGQYVLRYSADLDADGNVVSDGIPTLKRVENGMEIDVPNLKDIEPEDDKIVATLKNGSTLTFKMLDATGGESVANIDITGAGGMKVQVGSATGQEIQIVIPTMDSATLGIDNLDMSTEENAKKSIEKIEKAIEYVSRGRSQIGAYQNRLESTIDALAENIEDLTESYSTIKDVDMAEEMVNYTTQQVLVQAGTSMLTQANEQPQQALQLLQ